MSLVDHYVSSSGSASYASSTNSATPCSLAAAFTGAVTGDRVNIKADGAYTFSSNTLTAGGNATSPIIWRGYKTTPGDGYLGRSNGSGALITTNMPSITWTACNHEWSDHDVIETLNISGNANLSNVSNGNIGDGMIMWNFSTTVTYWACNITNTSTGGGIVQNGNGATVNCDITLSSGTDVSPAVFISGATQRVVGCRLKGAAAPAITLASPATIIGNILYRSTYGVYAGTIGNIAGQLTMVGNTIVNNSSDGFNISDTATTWSSLLVNNCVTDNGGYGFNLGNGGNTIAMLFNNRLRNNTSGNINATDWGTNIQYGTITSGGVSDYVNAASDDYRILTSSPAYQAGLLPYNSIGASQSQAAGGTRIAYGLNGGFNG